MGNVKLRPYVPAGTQYQIRRMKKALRKTAGASVRGYDSLYKNRLLNRFFRTAALTPVQRGCY